jgi:hypothetical protein
MEVHFKPEVQAKLEQMARDTGRPSDELMEDAVIGLFDELVYTRQTLNQRYDDLESGRVKPIPGDEVFARLRAKSAARRAQHRCQAMNFTRKRSWISTPFGSLSLKIASKQRTTLCTISKPPSRRLYRFPSRATAVPT